MPAISVSEVYAIIPSKNDDSLPLTSFRVEDRPCLSPQNVSSGRDEQLYPTEVDRENGCTEYDDRYNSTGLSI